MGYLQVETYVTSPRTHAKLKQPTTRRAIDFDYALNCQNWIPGKRCRISTKNGRERAWPRRPCHRCPNWLSVPDYRWHDCRAIFCRRQAIATLGLGVLAAFVLRFDISIDCLLVPCSPNLPRILCVLDYSWCLAKFLQVRFSCMIIITYLILL